MSPLQSSVKHVSERGWRYHLQLKTRENAAKVSAMFWQGQPTAEPASPSSTESKKKRSHHWQVGTFIIIIISNQIPV
jgi:hypothetical protein